MVSQCLLNLKVGAPPQTTSTHNEEIGKYIWVDLQNFNVPHYWVVRKYNFCSICNGKMILTASRTSLQFQVESKLFKYESWYLHHRRRRQKRTHQYRFGLLFHQYRSQTIIFFPVHSNKKAYWPSKGKSNFIFKGEPANMTGFYMLYLVAYELYFIVH